MVVGVGLMMTSMSEKGSFVQDFCFPPGGLFVTCCHFGELRNPHLCKLSLWNTQSYKLGQRPIGLVGVASWPHGLGHNKAVFIKSFDILKWVANTWNWSRRKLCGKCFTSENSKQRNCVILQIAYVEIWIIALVAFDSLWNMMGYQDEVEGQMVRPNRHQIIISNLKPGTSKTAPNHGQVVLRPKQPTTVNPGQDNKVAKPSSPRFKFKPVSKYSTSGA